MSKDSANRRAWVKNVAIIFLTVLLLLTFFSSTILNYSLPEVSAQYPKYASLTSAIKANGTVKANASYNVVYEATKAEADAGMLQSRKVISVFAKEGNIVEKDQIIITLQGGASEQLAAAQKEYDALKKQYDLDILGDSVSSLETQKQLKDALKAIEKAKKELDMLNEQYTALKNGVDNKEILKDQLKKLNKELEALTKQRDDVNAKKQQAESTIENDIFDTLTLAEKLAIAEDDYSVSYESYVELKEEVEFYKEQYESLKNSSADVGEANRLTAEIKTLREQLKTLIKNREDILDEYFGSIDEDLSNKSELKIAYENALSELNEYENLYMSQIDNLENLKSAYDSASTEYEKLSESEQKYLEAEADWETARDRVLTAKGNNADPEWVADLEAEEALCKNILDLAAIDRPNAESLEDAENNYLNAQSSYNTVLGYSNYRDELKTKAENAKDAYENAETSLPDDSQIDDKLSEINEQINEIDNKLEEAYAKLDIIGMPEIDDLENYEISYDLAEAERLYNEASTEFGEVELKYNAAKEKVESLRKQSTASELISEYSELIDTYNAEIEVLTENIADKTEELEGTANPDTLKTEIETKQSELENLETQYKITETNLKISSVGTSQQREETQKKLNELSVKIETYKNAPDVTEIKAPVAGRISSVNTVPGESVTSGNTVATIEITDQGYICEISMASEEARKIQIGTPCDITNSWWYSKIEASVSQIRNDPSSQGKNRIVVIEVTGDVYEGQTLNFSIGDKSQYYETVLPNSAIREDNDGKFVLVLESKKTPLGVRYTAKRVVIEVIASDNTQSAVSGLYGSEFVITNSNIPISGGQQVRLAENS